MPRIQAPDGTQIDFPDTMQEPDIETAMGKLYPKSSPPERPGFLSTIGSDLANQAKGLWNSVRHPIDSSEFGQAVNAANAIPSEAWAKANRDTAARGSGFPRAGMAPMVLRQEPEVEPSIGETAGHLVSPYIGDAALGMAGEGIESPAVRGFVGGALRAAPRAIRNAIPYGGGAALMNRFMPGPFATAADYAAAATAIPPIVRAGRVGMAGKEALGPVANAIFPRQPEPAGLIEGPADASYVRGRNAQFGEQPLLGPGARQAPPVPDASYVRGVPAMTHPSNPARALSAGSRVIQMPPTPDASYVRGVPAQYPEVANGPRPSAVQPALLPVQPPATPQATVPDYSNITKTYQPSRTRARFDASGKRIGG